MRGTLALLSGMLMLLNFFVFVARGAEVDSVTPRAQKVQLADSRGELNEIFAARLREGVRQANVDPEDLKDAPSAAMCDEEELYRELRKAIFQSATASLGLKGYGLDQELRTLLAGKSYGVPLAVSIYRDITYFEGISLNLKELSRVVNIDGQLVGLDKLGHFFAEGWEYFEKAGEEGGSLMASLRWGHELEKGLFGEVTTGIFSYSDMVANFNGCRFWRRVLGKQDDPLLSWLQNLLTNPYVRCRFQLLPSLRYGRWIRHWEYSGNFDIGDYVDGAWDEANNCNDYRNEEIREKVVMRSHDIYPDFHCPWEVDQCLAARKKYGPYAAQLLHPRCYGSGVATAPQ